MIQFWLRYETGFVSDPCKNGLDSRFIWNDSFICRAKSSLYERKKENIKRKKENKRDIIQKDRVFLKIFWQDLQGMYFSLSKQNEWSQSYVKVNLTFLVFGRSKKSLMWDVSNLQNALIGSKSPLRASIFRR